MAPKKDFKASNPAMKILSQAQEPVTKQEPVTISEPETTKGIVLDMSKTKKAPRNKRMQIMVTEETFTKLHALSEQNNISMNEVINQVLETLLKNS